ncbi:MAG: hypothetical protein EWM72_02564 [Nitrospira sp.]|nr:MAG: hypothetical protein EWM72_02564 [Nitrospira sp.]
MSLFEWAQTWTTEFWTFILSLRRHWVLLVTSSTVAAIGVFRKLPIEDYLWWIVGILLFWACFLAWRDEYKKALTRQLKRTIREGLADLNDRGVGLLLACERENDPPDSELQGRYAQWDEQSKTYLRTNLDRSYVTRFDNPVGLHVQYANLASGERTRIWRIVANRVARLQQFMDDYRDS